MLHGLIAVAAERSPKNMANNTTCTFPSLSNPRHHHLPVYVVAVTLASCCLSTFGSLVQILTYYLWKDLRTLSRELIVYISIADLFTATSLGFGILMNFQHSSNACIIQALISTFFTTSSLFWMVALLVYLLVTVVTVDPERSANLVKYFHTICWGVPAIVAIMALVYKGLGTTHNTLSVGWCWVKIHHTEPEPLFWILVTEKFWEFASCVCLVGLCCIIKIQISRKCNSKEESLPKGTEEAMRKIDKKVIFIPILFIFLKIWGTIRFALFVQNSCHTREHLLMVLQGIGDTGQGFTNFILFCVCTARTRKVISSEVSDLVDRTSCTWLINRCYWRTEHEEAGPLLRENNRDNLYVHYNCTAYNSSQSLSKSGQLLHV